MRSTQWRAVLIAFALTPIAAPAQTPPRVDPLVRIYGTVNARIVISSAAVESFSQPNAVAITAAGNPVLSDSPDEPRYTFQVGQTRMGLWINEKGALRAHLELDFVDVTRATPTVASLPRLRIARADWKISPRHMLALGQDWDLHAPMNPHGINLVGALFQAGNVAFMRQQLKYFYTSESFEGAAALGFPFNNNTPRDGLAELAVPPTLALRAAWNLGDNRIGISGIVTSLLLGRGAPDARRAAAFSLSLFADLLPVESTHIRIELNAGQNGANLGLLSLAYGVVQKDVKEAGGFVSVRHAFSEKHALIAMLGTERVLGSAPLPSYRLPQSPTGGMEAPVLAGTGPGIRNNTGGRLGYHFEVLPGGHLVVEGFGFRTHHVLQPQGIAAGVGSIRTAFGIETGVLYSF